VGRPGSGKTNLVYFLSQLLNVENAQIAGNSKEYQNVMTASQLVSMEQLKKNLNHSVIIDEGYSGEDIFMKDMVAQRYTNFIKTAQQHDPKVDFFDYVYFHTDHRDLYLKNQYYKSFFKHIFKTFDEFDAQFPHDHRFMVVNVTKMNSIAEDERKSRCHEFMYYLDPPLIKGPLNLPFITPPIDIPLPPSKYNGPRCGVSMLPE